MGTQPLRLEDTRSHPRPVEPGSALVWLPSAREGCWQTEAGQFLAANPNPDLVVLPGPASHFESYQSLSLAKSPLFLRSFS